MKPKFRVIVDSKIAGYEQLTDDGVWIWMSLALNPTEREKWMPGSFPVGGSREMFTGRTTINGKELYEGDKVFTEELVDCDLCDGVGTVKEGKFSMETTCKRCEGSGFVGEERNYLVIVWVSKWSMFASLILDEYEKYKKGGVDSIDETMFWTYNLENSDRDFHYAGTIHDEIESELPK